MVALLLAVPAVHAAPIVYQGYDIHAKSSDPRPNSNAAAAGFDAAVTCLGSTPPITVETATLGKFSNLQIAPGVTINGLSAFGNNQEIRNTTFCNQPLCGFNTSPGGTRWIDIQGGNLVITFSPPIEAFGGYFTGLELADQLGFNDGSPQVIPFTELGSDNGGVGFLGFTDFGKQIASISISTTEGGDFTGLDDVRVVPSAPFRIFASCFEHGDLNEWSSHQG